MRAFTAATVDLLSVTDGDVVLDLRQLRFVDAAGLGAIVGLCNTMTGTGRGLDIVGAAPRVRRVFDVGGLSDLLRYDPEFGPSAPRVT